MNIPLQTTTQTNLVAFSWPSFGNNGNKVDNQTKEAQQAGNKDTVKISEINLRSRESIKASLVEIRKELYGKKGLLQVTDLSAENLAQKAPTLFRFLEKFKGMVGKEGGATVNTIADVLENISQELKSTNNRYTEAVVLGSLQEIAKSNDREGDDKLAIQFLANLTSINSLQKWDALPPSISKGTAEAATANLAIDDAWKGGSLLYNTLNIVSLFSLTEIANKMAQFANWAGKITTGFKSLGGDLIKDDLKTAYERRFVNRNNANSILWNGISAAGTGVVIGSIATGIAAAFLSPFWVPFAAGAAGVAAGAFALGWAGQSRGGSDIMESIPGFGGDKNLSATELAGMSEDISRQLQSVANESYKVGSQIIRYANSDVSTTNNSSQTNDNSSKTSEQGKVDETKVKNIELWGENN